MGRPAKQGFAHMEVSVASRHVASSAWGVGVGAPNRASPVRAVVIALGTWVAVQSVYVLAAEQGFAHMEA